MKKNKKIRAAGTLTEAAYFAKIRSVLRRGFMYWKPMMLALEAAGRPYVGSNPRQKKEYQCAVCKEWFKRADIHIDHKIECGSLKTYKDIVPFIKRLTEEEVDSYQVLCKPHHLLKTKEERQKRKDEEK